MGQHYHSLPLSPSSPPVASSLPFSRSQLPALRPTSSTSTSTNTKSLFSTNPRSVYLGLTKATGPLHPPRFLRHSSICAQRSRSKHSLSTSMTEHRPPKRNTRTPPSKRSLGFTTPCSTAVSVLPSLSPPHELTDRALTFLQSARDRNVPVRCGMWSKAEDAYLHKLIALFQDGILAEIAPKTSLRSYLALMLNCCPMRISKKQMHGHKFIGKTKFSLSSSKIDRMTQHQYDQLTSETQRLRDEFVLAWVDEEKRRREAKLITDDLSFQNWCDKVLEMVPTPKLAKQVNAKEPTKKKKKRKLETLDDVMMQLQKKKKTVEKPVEIEEAVGEEQQQVQEPYRETTEASQLEPLGPVGIQPLEPAPIAESTLVGSPTPTYDNTVVALPTAFCSESVNMGDWLAAGRGCAASWNDFQSVNYHLGEARYTYCEDKVKVSVHLGDQQNSMAELSMRRKSSRLVIDFGAPSCWYAGEEPKYTPFSDDAQWTDNDLTDELAMMSELGVFGWDDSSSIANMTYSPTLNFL